MTPTLSDPRDLAQLAERGIEPEEAERQLAVLARPAAWIVLERPCTPGDGIEQLSDARVDALLATHARAAAAGRVSAFVPASGAATRMFRELLAARALPGELAPAAVRARNDEAGLALVRFVEALPRFAFAEVLARVLTAQGHPLESVREAGPWRVLLDALLGADGLDMAGAPKGLLLFHREGGETRTAFEEHLIEAVALSGDARGTRTLDVTVSAEHRAGFARGLAERLPALAARFGGRWQVEFTEQHPSTDTLAGEIGRASCRERVCLGV